ncbi:hypothetical protein LCGC14_1585890, partial [marine sediment metagenome]
GQWYSLTRPEVVQFNPPRDTRDQLGGLGSLPALTHRFRVVRPLPSASAAYLPVW